MRISESGMDSWIRIVTQIELIGPWAMPYPSKKFYQNPFDNFFSYPTDRQTDGQTDRSENITSFSIVLFNAMPSI